MQINNEKLNLDRKNNEGFLFPQKTEDDSHDSPELLEFSDMGEEDDDNE